MAKFEKKEMKTNFPLVTLQKILQVSLLLSGLFPILAHSHAISDLAGDAGAYGAYWGGNAHGYGDVIGGSTYDINGAEGRLRTAYSTSKSGVVAGMRQAHFFTSSSLRTDSLNHSVPGNPPPNIRYCPGTNKWSKNIT
ncbi:MAG: hypothetical protein ACREUR_02105 [Nitrosospira sp.]